MRSFSVKMVSTTKTKTNFETAFLVEFTSRKLECSLHFDQITTATEFTATNKQFSFCHGVSPGQKIQFNPKYLPAPENTVRN